MELSNDQELFPWYKLPQKIELYVLNLLTDEEKLQLVDTFPVILTMVKTFGYDARIEDATITQFKIRLFRSQ